LSEFVRKKSYEKWFTKNYLKKDLKSQSVRGGFNTISGQLISFALTISSTAILGRLLTPKDYGLVAMVTAITGFISIFKDLGLSTAVIQKDEIDQPQVSALFWMNILISSVIALVIAAIGPLLVYFYHEERLFYITIVFSVSVLFTGFSLQHNALMNRQMKFKNLSFISIISTTASIAIAILMAYNNWGYWAIVASMILTPVFSTILLWMYCDWRPDFVFRDYNIRSYIKFGAGITGFDLINYFSRNVDNVLIGKFIGPQALGLYSKAYALLLLPITQLRTPLNSVALPALSTLQKEKAKFKEFYEKYVLILSFFSMPVVVYLAVFSKEIIQIVLGDQWIAASKIFQLLAISSFIQPVSGTKGVVMISTGETKKYFIFGIVNAVFIICSFIIGLNWGIEGIAVSYAIANYLILYPSLKYAFGGTDITVAAFFKTISFPVVFSFIAGMAMFAFRYYLQYWSPFALLICGIFICGTVYLTLWNSSERSRKKFKEVYQLKNTFFNKK